MGVQVIHGTGDDNVHIQHTMALSRQMVDSNVVFRQQIYPDQVANTCIITLNCIIGWYSAQDHALAGVTRHLHRTMEAFLDEVFGPIHDYFEDDYFLAAAKLVEEYGMGEGG